MPATRKSTNRVVYQLKITLRESKPPIWRRIQVTDDTTLQDLHWILQIIMPWTNSHLHQFQADGEYYSDPEMEIEDALDETKVKIRDVVSGPKARFSYEYDFGDDWRHEILVEKVLPADPAVEYPVCLAGKLACPPEDIGGMWGYYHFLHLINDPSNKEGKELLEWVGGSFNPAEFDLELINKTLHER
ncbi:MAG TPA: plasmid pRiA4b ORF-3 family protein [Blastocatellia bacterium]|nr:plasmid pRiA4b ORF-3 family protein [Blastocatellia bacterium]